MLKKIAAAAALAGALAFSAAAPAVLSAGPVGNWVDQLGSTSTTAIGNWPDPMSKPVKDKNTDTTYTTYTGNWPDPM